MWYILGESVLERNLFLVKLMYKCKTWPVVPVFGLQVSVQGCGELGREVKCGTEVGKMV